METVAENSRKNYVIGKSCEKELLIQKDLFQVIESFEPNLDDRSMSATINLKPLELLELPFQLLLLLLPLNHLLPQLTTLKKLKRLK